MMKTMLILLISLLVNESYGNEKIHIPEGRISPQYGIEKNEKDQFVRSFFIDKYPISEDSFFKFVKKNPQWGKENAVDVFSDKNYLKISPRIKNHSNPVTYVSWFAANAFCSDRNGRLPTTLEWEYVHAASETKANAMKDKEYIEKLLQWYSVPSLDHDELIIGAKKPNFYGVHDINSFMWEWTSDFNSVLMTSDNRQDGDKNQNELCGASSIGARNKEDYSAFVRYSLRSSLQASYTLENLGFRCAYEK